MITVVFRGHLVVKMTFAAPLGSKPRQQFDVASDEPKQKPRRHPKVYRDLAANWQRNGKGNIVQVFLLKPLYLLLSVS